MGHLKLLERGRDALFKTGQFKEVIKLTSKVDSGRTPVNKSNADDIFLANLLGGRAFSKLKKFR